VAAWRVALVLVLDAAMAGAGGVLIWTWLGAAEAPTPTPAPQAEPLPPPAPPSSRPAPPRPPPAAPPPTASRPVVTVAPAPAPAPPRPRPAVIAAAPDAAPAPAPDASPVSPGPPDAARPPAPPDGGPLERPWVEQMTAGIRQVVEDHRAEIRECYRRAAKDFGAGPPPRGRIDVHLKVLPEGDADDVRVVENQTGSDALAICLETQMRSWRYPAPGAEPMEFVWPFTFRGGR
jgi:outer membrane biosynthesis protein TonB